MKLDFTIAVVLVILAVSPNGAHGWFWDAVTDVFEDVGKVITDTVEVVADFVGIDLPATAGANNCGTTPIKASREESNALGFNGIRTFYACCEGWERTTVANNDCDRAICNGIYACGNRGSCVKPSLCDCKSGYSNSERGCNDVVCINGADCGSRGVCSGPNTCTCYSGYEGKYEGCPDVDECATSNGGCEQTCVNFDGGFRCECDSGYNAIGTSCQNIDECTTGTHNCAHDCTDKTPGFTCSCHSGYKTTDQGVTCLDIDECTDDSLCESICVNQEGSYYCDCPVGLYVVDNKYCFDHDECTNGDHNCEHMCNNLDGSYQCDCRNGYLLDSDQASCNDINECETIFPCGIHSCVNIEGSYSCTCSDGYDQITSQECVDINECLTNVCDQMCTNEVGSYSCSCQPGFELNENQQDCDDVNECEGTNNCNVNAVCENSIGSYSCQCKIGYEGNGLYCTPVCSTPCLNGGTCTAPDTCLCVARFEGNDCSTPFCENCVNGQCIVEPETNVCSCYLGYQGTSCSDDVDECLDDPCSHECVNTVGSFNCNCPQGLKLDATQLNCEDHNECETDTHGCENCVNMVGSFYCVCFEGFRLIQPENKLCEDFDECTLDVCEQNCENTLGSYNCSCNEGYLLSSDGSSCFDIDECDGENDCQQICINVVGSYTCGCKNGFKIQEDLKTCIDVDECVDNSTHDCEHLCENNEGSFKCDCKDGHYLAIDGKTCKEMLNSWTTSKSGCECYYDTSRYDCPCCIDGGCQCQEKEADKCVQCGYGKDCETTIIEDAAPCFYKMRTFESLGIDQPKCDIRGRFTPKQCDDTGSCWCVDRFGKVREGTKTSFDTELLACENTNIVNGWTKTSTGCQCDFDQDRYDCACCMEGACSCGRLNPHICTQCGLVDNCGTIEARYPKELLSLP